MRFFSSLLVAATLFAPTLFTATEGAAAASVPFTRPVDISREVTTINMKLQFFRYRVGKLPEFRNQRIAQQVKDLESAGQGLQGLAAQETAGADFPLAVRSYMTEFATVHSL